MGFVVDGHTGVHGYMGRVRVQPFTTLQRILQLNHLIGLVTTIKFELMDFLGNELVLSRPGDVFDYRTEEAL